MRVLTTQILRSSQSCCPSSLPSSDVWCRYISGHNPDLVIYQDDGKSEIERIDLTKYDTQGKQQVDPGKVEALHTLLKSKGFKRGDWFLAQYFPMNTVNQFIKFTTIKTRYHSANNNMVQVAAFEFVDAGTLVKPIIAKNAGGDSPRLLDLYCFFCL
jgi:hypothetical protein